MLAYVKVDPTFTGLSRRTPLRMYSRTNANKPKIYTRKTFSFSTLSIMKDELIALRSEIREAIHTPENKKEYVKPCSVSEIKSC